jgi:hypothetical protein
MVVQYLKSLLLLADMKILVLILSWKAIATKKNTPWKCYTSSCIREFGLVKFTTLHWCTYKSGWSIADDASYIVQSLWKFRIYLHTKLNNYTRTPYMPQGHMTCIHKCFDQIDISKGHGSYWDWCYLFTYTKKEELYPFIIFLQPRKILST